jgi:hypothetical protein
MIWHWRPSLPHWAVGSWAARRPLLWTIYFFFTSSQICPVAEQAKGLCLVGSLWHTVTYLEHDLNLPAAKSPHRVADVWEAGKLEPGKCPLRADRRGEMTGWYWVPWYAATLTKITGTTKGSKTVKRLSINPRTCSRSEDHRYDICQRSLNFNPLSQANGSFL